MKIILYVEFLSQELKGVGRWALELVRLASEAISRAFESLQLRIIIKSKNKSGFWLIDCYS